MTYLDIETETGGTPLWTSPLLLVGLMDRAGQYTPIRSEPIVAAMHLNRFTEICGHNLMFDLCALYHRGLIPLYGVKYFDTMIALKHWDDTEPTYALKPWATFLGMDSYWGEAEAQFHAGTIQTWDMEKLKKYNQQDLLATRQIEQRLAAKVDTPAFHLDMAVLPLVVGMTVNGIGVDQALLEKAISYYDARANVAAIKLKLKWGEINLNSHQQIAKLLYDRLQIKRPRGVDPTTRSTSEEILTKLPGSAPKWILENRQALKMIRSFLLPLRGIEVVHGDFRIFPTASGRLSCHKPPLQTYPEKLRRIFKNRLGMFLWVDFDQVEFKILADLAHEKKLIRLINDGWDVHDATGKLLGIVDRKTAKTLNYAYVFRAGVRKMMETAGLSYRQALDMRASYGERLRQIQAYSMWSDWEIEKGHVVVNPFGRRRSFKTNYDIAPQAVLSKHQREGFNTRVQGFAHDLVLLFWTHVDRALREAGVKYQWVNEVHDELVMDLDPTDETKARQIVHYYLDNLSKLCYDYTGYRLQVNITATIKTGANWR